MALVTRGRGRSSSAPQVFLFGGSRRHRRSGRRVGDDAAAQTNGGPRYRGPNGSRGRLVPRCRVQRTRDGDDGSRRACIRKRHPLLGSHLCAPSRRDNVHPAEASNPVSRAGSRLSDSGNDPPRADGGARDPERARSGTRRAGLALSRHRTAWRRRLTGRATRRHRPMASIVFFSSSRT